MISKILARYLQFKGLVHWFIYLSRRYQIKMAASSYEKTCVQGVVSMHKNWHHCLFSLLASSCSSSNTEDQNMNIIPKDPSGIIKTPGYPSTYPLPLTTQCIWKIIAPKGQVIRLDFSSFRIGKYCCLDIDLYSINKKSPLDIFECNAKPSFTVYSTGRELS